MWDVSASATLSRVTSDQPHQQAHHGYGNGISRGDAAAEALEPTSAGLDEASEWDERYVASERVWSGRPNSVLVSEVASLEPGRALDIGCGEGADAVWLAQHGWDVTGLDVSGVALERAQAHALEAGAEVGWVHSGLVEAELPVAGFDLVSAQYPSLRRTADAVAERALLSAVAPGGVLLVVHHAHWAEQPVREDGFDPADYVGPSDVAAVLDDDWIVEVDDVRPRDLRDGAGARHKEDVVLRARRLR